MYYQITSEKIDLTLLIFVFTSTLFTYNFQRIAKIKSGQAFSGERLEWMTTNFKLVVILTVLSGISSLSLMFFLNLAVLKLLIPFAVISLLYVGKYPFTFFINLRDIPFIKTHLVAAVWAGTTSLLPVFQNNNSLELRDWILFIAVYLFILSLAILFDVRDAELDEPEKKTLPQIFGKKNALIFAVLFLLAAILLLIYLRFDLLIPLIIFVGISLYFYSKTIIEKSDFLFSFWLDGLIILLGLTVFVFA